MPGVEQVVVDTHWLFLQAVLDEQALPQAPQLFWSEVRSTQEVPQVVGEAAGHADVVVVVVVVVVWDC